MTDIKERIIKIYGGRSTVDEHPAYFHEYFDENCNLIKISSPANVEIYDLDIKQSASNLEGRGIKVRGFKEEVPSRMNGFIYESLPKNVSKTIIEKNTVHKEDLEKKIANGCGCTVHPVRAWAVDDFYASLKK